MLKALRRVRRPSSVELAVEDIQGGDMHRAQRSLTHDFGDVGALQIPRVPGSRVDQSDYPHQEELDPH